MYNSTQRINRVQELPAAYYIRDIIALRYPSNSTFHHFGISYGRSMSNAYNARASIPLKLTLHRDTYLITTRLYSFPLDLRSREHRGFGEDLRSNAHDAGALKFFAKRREAYLLRAGQEEAAVIGIPCTVPRTAVHRLAVTRCDMRYADCAATTSSYRNESIEALSRRYACVSVTRYPSFAAARLISP